MFTDYLHPDSIPMPNYLQVIKNNLEKQIKLENTTEQYKGTVIRSETLVSGSLVTLEMAKNKNLKQFKVNDKILINNKIAAKFVDISGRIFICKSKYAVKINSSIFLRLSVSTTERLYKNVKLLLEGKLQVNNETLAFVTNSSIITPLVEDIMFYNKSLNESQKLAVKLAVGGNSYKLIGPPGTGKTTCIIEMILQLLKKEKKLLICGPSNAALDNVMSFLVINNTKWRCVRIGDSLKCKAKLQKYCIDHILESELEYLDNELKIQQNERHKATKRKKKTYSHDKQIKAINNEKHRKRTELMQQKIEECEIVFSTLYSTMKIDNKLFDTIIVDECCQANDSELLLSILKAKNFVLIGDPYQLGPVSILDQSDTLYNALDIYTIMLNEQYRMAENLISFANSYFYDAKIMSNRISNFKFFDESNILFIDMFNSVYSEETYELSNYNKEEITIILSILKYLASGNDNLSIGIIVPYSAQVKMIKEEINCKSNLVTVNTVDSFQGQERDIIIVSMVRSNYDQDIGFMNEIRRMNVALTRCKEGLVAIGNSVTFEDNDYYKRLFAFLDKNAYSFDHENFLKFVQCYLEDCNDK